MNPRPLAADRHTLRVLDGLLQSERAVASAYTTAIHSFPDSKAMTEGVLMQGDHLENIDRLVELVLRHGGTVQEALRESSPSRNIEAAGPFGSGRAAWSLVA